MDTLKNNSLETKSLPNMADMAMIFIRPKSVSVNISKKIQYIIMSMYPDFSDYKCLYRTENYLFGPAQEFS